MSRLVGVVESDSSAARSGQRYPAWRGRFSTSAGGSHFGIATADIGVDGAVERFGPRSRIGGPRNRGAPCRPGALVSCIFHSVAAVPLHAPEVNGFFGLSSCARDETGDGGSLLDRDERERRRSAAAPDGAREAVPGIRRAVRARGAHVPRRWSASRSHQRLGRNDRAQLLRPKRRLSPCWNARIRHAP